MSVLNHRFSKLLRRPPPSIHLGLKMSQVLFKAKIRLLKNFKTLTPPPYFRRIPRKKWCFFGALFNKLTRWSAHNGNPHSLHSSPSSTWEEIFHFVLIHARPGLVSNKTISCLVNSIDVPLADKDGIQKLVMLLLTVKVGWCQGKRWLKIICLWMKSIEKLLIFPDLFFYSYCY